MNSTLMKWIKFTFDQKITGTAFVVCILQVQIITCD